MKTPRTDLELCQRHLGWGAEALHRAAHSVEGATYRSAVAVAMADLASLEHRIQNLTLLVSASEGKR